MAKILLIDSPDYHSPVFLNMLQREGNYEVSLVTSQEGYEADCREMDIALVADLRIPGREKTDKEPWNSGLAVLKDIREKGLPALVLAREPEKVEEQARALGAKVLTKPLHIQNILNVLKELEPEQPEKTEETGKASEIN